MTKLVIHSPKWFSRHFSIEGSYIGSYVWVFFHKSWFIIVRVVSFNSIGFKVFYPD